MATTLTAPVDPKRDHTQGSTNAKVTLLEYADFECPYCGEAYHTVKEIQQRLGDQIFFVFRHYPLIETHPHAEHAAEAAEAAASQGKFWEMHAQLFEHQKALGDAHLVQYATELQLDREHFIQEMDNQTHTAHVEEDMESGTNSGVEATPTFFINGVRHEGAFDLQTLLDALEKALRA